jgi:hypothetical protein
LRTGQKFYELNQAARIFPLHHRLREASALAVISSEAVADPAFALPVIGRALKQDPYSPLLQRWYAEFQFRAGDIAGASRTINGMSAFVRSAPQIEPLAAMIAQRRSQ